MMRQDRDDFDGIFGGRRRLRGAPIAYQSPVDPTLACHFAGASADDVDVAVGLARKAQAEWADLSPNARRGAMMALAAGIEAEAGQIALFDCEDMGKPISVATEEAYVAAHMIRWYAECIDKTGGSVAASSADALSVSVRQPYGVVASMISWNYPAINAALKIAPAIAAGNAIVLKPSELAPRSAIAIAAIASGIDGLPPGLVNVVPGGAETGAALARHPKVSMLAFTGSTETARRVAGFAAERIVPAIIEAGGKNPILVCDDASDIEGLARDALGESYANSGQLCVARSKLIVPRSRVAELHEALAAAARSLGPGPARDPATRFGPLGHAAHARRISAVIEEASKRGETILTDGRPDKSGDLHFAPTLIAAEAGSPLLTVEHFGPVLATVVYDDIEEGVGLANLGGYGLAATLWTEDIGRARALSRQLHCGHVVIKSVVGQVSDTGLSLPREPAGQSGYGTEFGLQALESYSRRQAIEYVGRRYARRAI